MAAKPKHCVFCGELTTSANRSREHCIPQCLWPDALPQRMVTVPAHRTCNSNFATDDEFFRNFLVALEGADRHPAARKLIDGNVNTCYVKNPRIMSNHLRNLSRRNVVSPGGLHLGTKPVFEVENDRLHRVMDKICRGLFYAHSNRLLAQTHEVDWFHVMGEEKIRHADQMIRVMKPLADFGDTVFRYRHYFSEQNPDNSAWLLIFYDSVAFIGTTSPKDAI